MSTGYEHVCVHNKVATIGHGPARRPLAFHRQESFGSFTTEDADVFHSVTLPKKVSPPVCRRKLPSDKLVAGPDNELQTVFETRAARRRSKSVGEMTVRLKLIPDANTSEVSSSCHSVEHKDVRLLPVIAADPAHVSASSVVEESSVSEVSSECVPPLLPPRAQRLVTSSKAGGKLESKLKIKQTNHLMSLGGGSDTLAVDNLPISENRLKDKEAHPSVNSIQNKTVHCALSDNSDSREHSAGDRLLQRTVPGSDPGIGCKLTHKETSKLSRRLTRKMSCRQKQALMMEGEFDEFDELNVIVEGESDEDELSDRNERLMVPGGEKDADSDNSDVEFEKRVATKMNFERLQVDGDDIDTNEELKAVEMSKVQRIANELLCTERTYVKKLHLIDQVFHFEIIVRNREFHLFPEDVVPQMFSNIKSIYQFHNDFLLPQLEQRIINWHKVPRIGDVMKKFAPFLKLYTDYVRNFDHAMETINSWIEKSPKFASMLEELQKLPECGHLTLQHHMLEPIQRVPRYELILRDYMKHLEANSVDREDTQCALELVSKAAVHSNEAMRKIEKFRKLLDISESLGDNIDLISPTRELIKEGKILRISERDGDRYERYMMLFSDLLLVCHNLPVVIGSKQKYKIKSKIDIDGMEVCDGNNLEIANTFIVKGRQKSIELLASSPEEKLEWQTAIEDAIVDYTRKLLSRKATLQFLDVVSVQELGKRAPTWIKDQETSMCMRCSDNFTAFRRRHHCRACGLVVCNKCSSRKIRLAYDDDHENRVCNDCFKILQQTANESVASAETHGQPQPRKKGPGFLQVKASDPSIICAYLNMSCDRKTWHRRWFAVHKDFVLYSFKAHQDVVAMTSLPLPGYRVSVVRGGSDGTDPEDKFRIYHRGDKKTYYFQADSRTVRNKWVEVLEKVVFMELPDPVTLSPTASVSVRDVARSLSTHTQH
jgi:hypothetical protein